MAGGQSGGQPGGQPGERAQGQPGGLPDEQAGEQPSGRTGGLSGSEWWRVDGPWRVLGAAAPGGAQPAEDGVYVDEPAAARPFAEPAVRRVPGAQAPAAEIPVPQSGRSASRARPLLRKRRPAGPSAEPAQPAAAWLIAPAAPATPAVGPVQPPSTADFPGWDSVVIEFPPDDTEPAARPIPEQRRLAEESDPDAAEEGDLGTDFAPSRGFLTGRRPSPLLLLAVAVLVGGVVTGLILVMLAGWGLAYLSHRMGDLTKKFAVFGIPLVTMSFSSLWFWGRAQGRWGDPLSKGAPMTHALLASAPAVLRVAAVLSAFFLLAVTMRRRRRPED